jgi:hypothetical protein
VAVSGNAVDRRIVRGAVLATLAAVLTVAGHLAGGGSLPELTVLVVLIPLLAGVITALANRFGTALGAIAVLAVGQLVLHRLIEALTPTHAEHHIVEATRPGDGGMVAMHVLVTLLTAAALRYADRALDALGAALARVLPRRPAPLSADRPLATLATPGPVVALRLARALAAAHVRRGPPVGC